MKKGPLANKDAQKELEELQAVKREQYDADLKAVMSTNAGRRFIFRLIFDTGRAMAASWTGNSETFFREGQRSVALFMANECRRVCPQDYVRMQVEELDSSMADEERQRELAAKETETDE